MAMDEIFHFDEQEFVSEPIELGVFLRKAIHARNSMYALFEGTADNVDAWQSRFAFWLQKNAPVGEQFAKDLKLSVDMITDEYRRAARQYCYDKDGGRGQRHLNKRSRLRCIRILEELNGKRKNPQYKSISLRSMIYDKYDANVFVRCLRQNVSVEPVRLAENDTNESGTSSKTTSTTSNSVSGVTNKSLVVSAPCDDTSCTNSESAPSLPTVSDAPSNLPPERPLMYNPYEDVCSGSINYPCTQQQFVGIQEFECSYGSQSLIQSPTSAFRFPVVDDVEPGWNQCPDVNTFVPYPPGLSETDWFPQTEINAESFTDAFYPNETTPFALQMKCSWDMEEMPVQELPMHLQDNPDFEADLSGLSCESRLKINEEMDKEEERKICAALPCPSISNVNNLVVKEENPTKYPFLEPALPAQPGFLHEVDVCPSSFDQVLAKQPLVESLTMSADDDIVVEVAIFIGYPRPLEKHEIRLGRLMKVLDRFLVLGSNTLKDVKNVIDCTYDYQVIEDVSNRLVRKEDFSRNRFPSSFFFIHDTFYIDLEPEGAKDITAEIRQWASERSNIGSMKVADMNTTRVVDLTCRFGAPYLYNHVGACEHLIVITTAALRDDSHPNGPYPLPIYERNFRRIACGGCKEGTAEWVVWEHECMPSFTTFLCDSCYKEFNFEKGTGRKIFTFKAAPCYDRRNRRAGPVELQNLECFKDSASTVQA